MEGTDVWPVRARHHVLVSGATPRRRPLCPGGSEAPISVGAEGPSGDRAVAHVRSSDRGSQLRTCVAADSSAAVAPHGAAGTWRPTSVGSSFPVQAGVDTGAGAGPDPGFIKRNVRVESTVVTRHGCGRGQTSKGSCTTGKASLALLLRRWARRDAGKVVNPMAGCEAKQTRRRCSGESRRDGEKPCGRNGTRWVVPVRRTALSGAGEWTQHRWTAEGWLYEPHERRRSAGIVGVQAAR
jgi:hypothetical protein